MKFSLPESASDLLIKDGKLLMRSLSVYEVLRRFKHIIRLTPFRFEDFTAALLAEDQSALLAEVHIQLMKSLIREDKQQQTWLGPPDIRDSVNLYLHLTDHANWPSALRIYLSADPTGNKELLDLLVCDKDKFYPFNVSSEVRLAVLEQLCDQFLLSVIARDEIVNGYQSAIKHETTCRSCSKANGDLIRCSECPATYHLKCSDPALESYPDPDSEPYLCSLCRLNRLTGVTDCISEEELSGNLKRHEPICIDASGHRYWFLVRRLFVVDELEDDVRYYTSPKEFDELLENLNQEHSDEELVGNLSALSDEIKRQMEITDNIRAAQLKSHKMEDGTYSMQLGQDGTHRCYVNHYTSAVSTKHFSDRDLIRGLSNKFCMASLNNFKWLGATDGSPNTITLTIKSTLLKLEATIPNTFIHPCWQSQRAEWIRLVNSAQDAQQYGVALTKLERCIKPILFKTAWFDSLGFLQLFRSTVAEREELKKTDRQPRGFERNERVSADFELCYRLGTMVKFSAKLKPVKHQVWKQKGEEYRLTGLNGWYWQAKTRRSRRKRQPRTLDIDRLLNSDKSQIRTGAVKATAGDGFSLVAIDKSQQAILNRCRPKLPPYHDFQTFQGHVKSVLVLPELELRRLARSAGLREVKSFSYTAKQNSYIWPYGMTPRPVFRTCWLYRNQSLKSIQDVALQFKVLYACLRWDELQARPPPSGNNTIVTDDATITIELLKKREKLPYLTHSEYLIRKTTTPNELPEPKKRKTNSKNSNKSLNSSLTPSRSGLRARRPVEREEEKGPTREEIWVPEDQLELWELKHFDEKIERQNALLRERALREEAERRRRIEEEKRRVAEQERRKAKAQEEAAKRARTYSSLSSTSSSSIASNNTPAKTNRINIPITQPNVRPQTPTIPQAATPVLRYFRTEGGQIIRLPASYLQLGTPLILRHVNPSNPNQTNTYIIRPQAPAPAVQQQGQAAQQQQQLQQKQEEPKPKTKLDQKQQPIGEEEEQNRAQEQAEPKQELAQDNAELVRQKLQPERHKTEIEQQKFEPELHKPEPKPEQAQEQRREPELATLELQGREPDQRNHEPPPEQQQRQEQMQQSDQCELGPEQQRQEEPSGAATESVGTVANEMAHDQRAPEATPPLEQQPAQQTPPAAAEPPPPPLPAPQQPNVPVD